MKKIFITLFMILFIITGCKNIDGRGVSMKTNESSKTMKSTESDTEQFYVRTPNSDETIRSSDSEFEDVTVPKELIEFCAQNFELIRKEKELIVEKKEIDGIESIVVELIDSKASLDHLIAVLTSEGEIEKYLFKGDDPASLYAFINYQEGSSTISNDISNFVEKNNKYETDYSGKRYNYFVKYDLFRSGKNLGYIVTIIPEK